MPYKTKNADFAGFISQTLISYMALDFYFSIVLNTWLK